MATSNIWPPIVASNNFIHGNCPEDAWNGSETHIKDDNQNGIIG
jgi:hypothetical protein